MGQSEVLEVLQNANRELLRKEIAKRLHLSGSSVNLSLRKLLEQNLIEMKRYSPKDVKYKIK